MRPDTARASPIAPRSTREWSVFLDAYPLVLCPFLMRSMYTWDYDAQGFEQVKDLFMAAIYSTGINYLSLPAGVVPIGFADGLPAGVQIVGRPLREDLILDAMEAVEASVGILTHELWSGRKAQHRAAQAMTPVRNAGQPLPSARA